jgi:hypothetical protein
VVPELTRNAHIQLNKRFSLRRCAVPISLADDAGSPLEFHLYGRLGCLGGVLALVPIRLCRGYFLALNESNAMTVNHPTQQQPIPNTRLWPSIVVLSCVCIVAAGALALVGWTALALLGY